jgi:hypothetical protein
VHHAGNPLRACPHHVKDSSLCPWAHVTPPPLVENSHLTTGVEFATLVSSQADGLAVEYQSHTRKAPHMTSPVTRNSCKLQPSHVVRESEQPYALGTGVSVTYAPDFAPGKPAWLVRFATDTDARMTSLLQAGWTHVLKRGALRMYDSAESKAQVQALLGEHAPKAAPGKSKSRKPASTPKAAPVEDKPKVTVTQVGTPASKPAPVAATPATPVVVESMADATEMRMMLKHARKAISDLTMLVEILESRLDA